MQNAGRRAEWRGRLLRAELPVEMTEELVGAIDEVN
jgi:hypothetical protein